jgi:hypothetical protein
VKTHCRHGNDLGVHFRCNLCEKEYVEIRRQAIELRAKNPASSTSAPLAAARQEESHGSSSQGSEEVRGLLPDVRAEEARRRSAL